MDSLMLSFGSVRLEGHTILLSFLLAFLLSSLVAWVYQRTFAGLSWSRGLMQSMVLGSLISCLLMIAIGDNVARGIGIVGSLAVIRFRTNLRDPRDLVFVFAALGVGVASGVQSYLAAVIGAAAFCLVAWVMTVSPFGNRNRHDGMVRFQLPSGPGPAEQVAEIMRTIPRSFALVTMRNVAQGEMVEHAYQVALKNAEDGRTLVARLDDVEGIRGLTYMNQNTTVEV
ncbi:MAG: DUF4956 domain-containing protein [Deltaproteobacteria bacterium]|nr:DUF4956 domain-containing protein [Deltaproteobacteria bacterium]